MLFMQSPIMTEIRRRQRREEIGEFIAAIIMEASAMGMIWEAFKILFS